ncbi:MAG: hypothetical protein ACI9ZV_000220 [Candidatus Azotimanducaceae bacterium]|jgi:hypothetical protein
MSQPIKNIQAHPSPQDSRKMQLTYETEDSRHVIFLPSATKNHSEPEPHGAGSFHDPEHQHKLMDRVEAMLKQA